ncbi:CDG_1a_G0043850.mRNA.1.CDS.1 [Saccharomyces cerevisiae]|nr:CDG_1a_G0043850.mRNA.1.CDS.1 [Saccharomyces cerevisiae]CAI7436782.1 CDG_1a_G0043850.mRNA.1.CDS.1 [Saccharomyces cerevisiae]
MKVSDRLWPNQSGKIRTGAMDRKRSLKSCHSVMVGKNVKFLTFVEDEPDLWADQSFKSIFIPKKINLMFYMLFHAHTLKFNKRITIFFLLPQQRIL